MVFPLRDNAPSYAVPVVNLLLILANIVVFLIQLFSPLGFEGFVDTWGEVPRRILAGENVPGTAIPAWVTLFTAMFMHADFWHIFGNMYALWLFGDNVEWLLGRAKYFIFYILCGLAASGVTVLLGSASDEPGIGASGAIAGVLAVYLIFYPRARITSLVWFGFFSLGHIFTGKWWPHLRNISAFWFIGSWILFQLLFSGIFISLHVNLNLGIYAHAGGALAGAVLVWLFVIRDRIPSADSPARSDELTMPIFGDEGPASEGEVYEDVYESAV